MQDSLGVWPGLLLGKRKCSDQLEGAVDDAVGGQVVSSAARLAIGALLEGADPASDSAHQAAAALGLPELVRADCRCCMLNAERRIRNSGAE